MSFECWNYKYWHIDPVSVQFDCTAAATPLEPFAAFTEGQIQWHVAETKPKRSWLNETFSGGVCVCARERRNGMSFAILLCFVRAAVRSHATRLILKLLRRNLLVFCARIASAYTLFAQRAIMNYSFFVDPLNNLRRNAHTHTHTYVSADWFRTLNCRPQPQQKNWIFFGRFLAPKHNADRTIKTINLSHRFFDEHLKSVSANVAFNACVLCSFFISVASSSLRSPGSSLFHIDFDLIATLKSIETPAQSSIKAIKTRRQTSTAILPSEMTLLFIFCVTLLPKKC